jgi:hypothetical protein
MTTKQLVARVKKLYNDNGSINLNGMQVHEYEGGEGDLVTLDRVCVDDNELGVVCVGDEWFIPLTELTYEELMNIVKMYQSK